MAAQSSSAHAGFTAAALILCTFALLSCYAQADCGDFTKSCSWPRVTKKGWLSAICKTDKGGLRWPTLDLNKHISNNNGNLVDGAAFVASCKNIRWYRLSKTNAGVAAECAKKVGGLGTTTRFNPQRRAANYNGNQVFKNCRRRSLLEVVDEGTSIAGRKMLST